MVKDEIRLQFATAMDGIPISEFDIMAMVQLLIKIAISIYQDYADQGIEDLEGVIVENTKRVYDELCEYDWPKINNAIEPQVKAGLWTFIEWSIRTLVKDGAA